MHFKWPMLRELRSCLPPRPRLRSLAHSMPQCDADHPAPPPPGHPPVQKGPKNSAKGAAIATAATPSVPVGGHASRRSPTPPRRLDEDGGSKCNVDKKDDDAESHASTVRSWSGSLPSFCLTDGAPGDIPLSETVLGEMLILPDENPPTDYESYRQGDFSGGAAVAAESSADALGAQVQKKGKTVAGVFGILQGNWGQPGTKVKSSKEYMWADIKSGAATFVCLQEVYPPLYAHLLEKGSDEGVGVGPDSKKGRPTSTWDFEDPREKRRGLSSLLRAHLT